MNFYKNSRRNLERKECIYTPSSSFWLSDYELFQGHYQRLYALYISQEMWLQGVISVVLSRRCPPFPSKLYLRVYQKPNNSSKRSQRICSRNFSKRFFLWNKASPKVSHNLCGNFSGCLKFLCNFQFLHGNSKDCLRFFVGISNIFLLFLRDFYKR